MSTLKERYRRMMKLPGAPHPGHQRGAIVNRRSSSAGFARRTRSIESSRTLAIATSLPVPIVASATPSGSTIVLLPTPIGGG